MLLLHATLASIIILIKKSKNVMQAQKRYNQLTTRLNDCIVDEIKVPFPWTISAIEQHINRKIQITPICLWKLFQEWPCRLLNFYMQATKLSSIDGAFHTKKWTNNVNNLPFHELNYYGYMVYPLPVEHICRYSSVEMQWRKIVKLFKHIYI